MTFGLPQRLIAAGALCLLSLIALVLHEGRARASGAEVILAMRPVDPRSILSGHYVAMAFEIPAGAECPHIAQTPNWNGYAWLALRRSGEEYVLADAGDARADVEAQGDVIVRGNASCNPPVMDADGIVTAALVQLRLPVERFHADQDEAEAIQKAVGDRESGEARVYAILSVDKAGTPRTKGIIIDGKRVELTWF